MPEYVTTEQCGFKKENCYKHNIKPIMDEIKELKGDFKDFSKDFQDFKEDLKEVIAVIPYQVFEKTMGESDKKYATKLTQKVVYALVGVILLAFIGGVITLVIK